MNNFNELRKFVDEYKVDDFGEKCVYSVCFGDYDEVKSSNLGADFSYYLFTDKVGRAGAPWKEIVVDLHSFDSRWLQRFFKCLPHVLFPNFDESIYFDASTEVLKDLSEFYNLLIGSHFAVFRHPNRFRLSDELDACLDQKKGDPSEMQTQVKKYFVDGFPDNFGLWQTNVLYRRHNEADISNVCDLWASEIFSHSIRDQLSFPYAVWKSKCEISTLDLDPFYNEFLIMQPHASSPLHMRVRRYLALKLYLYGYLRR